MTPAADVKSDRLVSLDAYRGFVMLLMISGGLGISKVAAQHEDSRFWRFLNYQFEHVAWTGCSLWDLIQPSFMFIVGVAMPYSLAARATRGESTARLWGHVLYRAAALVALGIFLRSNGRAQTNFTFEDVVTQIGLGYIFLYFLLGRGGRVQLAALAAILFGYWMLFALWPVSGEDANLAALGIPNDWRQFSGFAAHWNKHVNPAGWFDRWFLNLFPRPEPFTHNGGGYQTLNFIPSMGTALLGVMAGELLRGPRRLEEKIRDIAFAGLACLACGMALDGRMWPYAGWEWSLCPVVKRIWTPSWALFSGGWTLLLLAAFLWVIDLKGYRRWAFPLIVAGVNSVALYVMSWLFKGWVSGALKTHLGQDFFAHGLMPIAHALLVTFVLWYFAFWLYRRKVFIRI